MTWFSILKTNEKDVDDWTINNLASKLKALLEEAGVEGLPDMPEIKEITTEIVMPEKLPHLPKREEE